jgi:ATP-dependent Clp protease ATP-binding subunit ClpC
MLLQIFDDGHLTDAKGRKVDFRNTIIIMTSNVGSDLIRNNAPLGFAVTKDEVKTAEQQYGKMKERVTDELKRVFRPEFLNRIDSQVVFHPLSKEHIRSIVDLQLRELEKQLLLKGVSLELTDVAKDWLGEKGYDTVFGARPLRRVIQNELEDRLSEALLQERFTAGDTVIIDVAEDGDLVLTTKTPVPEEPVALT